MKNYNSKPAKKMMNGGKSSMTKKTTSSPKKMQDGGKTNSLDSLFKNMSDSQIEKMLERRSKKESPKPLPYSPGKDKMTDSGVYFPKSGAGKPIPLSNKKKMKNGGKASTYKK
jgi:hypothetical protein